MKKFLLSMAIMLIATASAFAQVPTVMMYQVQVNHGKAAAQNVTIEMQLRKSQTGSAVWNQTFELKDVKNGSVQNLGLDFGSKVNLGTGEYWLATIVDGVEKGCAKLTSVPYAMVAKTLEGAITENEILGTWERSYTDEEEIITIKFEFLNNGTFKYKETRKYHSYIESKIANGVWKVTGTGSLYYSVSYESYENDKLEYEGGEEKIVPTMYFKENGKLILGGGDNFFGDDLVIYKGNNGLPEDSELDSRVFGSWTTTIVDDEDGDYTVTFIINADGTYTQLFQGADWSDSVSGVWSTKGNTVYFKQNDDSDEEEEVVTATYTINGDTLTLSIEEDGETEEVTLKKK